MKQTFNHFLLSASKINKTHLQFAFMLLALVMLVLGGGAPEDIGGVGRQLILLTAIFAGVLTSWGYARWKGWIWHPPVFQSIWLVVVGFLPQWFAFYMPLTRQHIPDEVASACLVCSQLLLLVFAVINSRITGMPLLAFGLGCNLAVILANGGFMPLPWEAAASLAGPSILSSLELGERISSGSKDVLLLNTQIVLPWLADRFVPPDFMPYRFAFSLGDVFIAAGAFWLLVARKNFIPWPSSGEV